MAADKDIMAMLRKGHPRLIFTQEDEQRAKELRKTDPYFEKLCGILIREADSNLKDGVIEHKKIGRRLLSQTRNSQGRICHLSAAYRMTGDKKYLVRAEEEMLAACALSDWNPSHFLDVAEMCAGLAIGYDWLYDDLSEKTRATIREAMIKKGLEPGFARKHWWTYGHNNWNQVCNGGLMMAALAMAEDEPEWARKAVARAVDAVKVCMKASYDPMGVYPEGAGYWAYGTSYNVMLIASLDSALGDDFGLTKAKGFLDSALFRLLVVGPDGFFYTFSDTGRGGKSPEPALQWFAKRYQRPDIAWLANEQEQGHVAKLADPSRNPNAGRLFPMMLAWYSKGEKPTEALPLDYFGDGANPIALFRSSWDPDAAWLAVKGGNNQNSHNHMDAGSFIAMAGGVRWSDDLVKDSYTKIEAVTGLWNPKTRYELFRFGVQGHSTLQLNGKRQELKDSASPVTRFHSSPLRSHAIIDMSKVWRSEAKSVVRGAALLNKRSFLVQDEIAGCTGEITWAMITVKDVELEKGTARLKKNGKHFTARILAPAGAAFELMSVKPKFDAEIQNEDISKLGISVPATGEPVTIAVHMWLEDGEPPVAPKLEPLDRWPND